MKKLSALTLTVFMLLSLMSCTPKPKSAYEIITDAQAKIEKLDSCNMSIDMDMNLGTQGITFGIPVSADFKVSGINSDYPKASLCAKLSYMGISINLDFYYEDEYLYLSAMGTNAKFNTKELTNTQPNEDSATETEEIQKEIDQILKDVLAEAEVKENEDGSQTVSYTISSEKLDPFMKKMLKDVTTENEGKADTSSQEIKVSDLEITQTVDKNGYITVSDIKLTLSLIEYLSEEESSILGMESMEVTFEIDVIAKLNNPGSSVEVTPMEGYESFEEASPEEAIPEDLITIM